MLIFHVSDQRRSEKILQLFLPVREIHPGDVHAVLDELEEDLGTAAGRPDGAHDSGQTHPKHNHTNKNNTNLYGTVQVLIIIVLRIRIRCLSYPWIRDPGWVKKRSGIRIRYENPKSFFLELRNNFLG